MTIGEFAAMTRRIIANDGFEGFLPTFCYPAQRHISVLEGYPDEIVPEAIVLERAAHGAEEEEFLVAFKIDAGHFRIIRCAGDSQERENFSATA